MTVDELVQLVQDITKGMSVSDLRAGKTWNPVDELEPQSWGILIRFLSGERPTVQLPAAYPTHVLPAQEPAQPLASRHLDRTPPTPADLERIRQMEFEWEARDKPLELGGEFKGVELI